MFNFQNILFPVDLSPRDEAVAPFVLSMAQRYHARIFVLHGLQPPPPIYVGMHGVYPDAFDSNGAIEDIRIALGRFVESQLPKVEVECVVECGDPAGVISRYACDKGIHLIAMPTHGYGVFRRALLGSVTAKVLHDSALPVWTSAHAPEQSHRAHPQPRRIVCALDMKPESQRTLEAAIALARDAGASLEIVHVPAETASPDAIERRLQEQLIAAARTEMVDIQEEAEIAPEPEGESPNVADTVRSVALGKRADLVVIGRGAIRTPLGWLNANSYEIIRESPCPVLSV